MRKLLPLTLLLCIVAPAAAKGINAGQDRIIVLNPPAKKLVFHGADSDMPEHGEYLLALPGVTSDYSNYKQFVKDIADKLPNWMVIAVRRSSGDHECLVMVNDIDYLALTTRYFVEMAHLDAAQTDRYEWLNGALDNEQALVQLQQDICEYIKASR